MLEPHHDFDPATEEGALVAAIRARPMDDTPKLVMADWQDDHGSPVVAAMYRHVVHGGLPDDVGHVTREDGAAVSRHAGLLSSLATPKPVSTWLDGTMEDAVNRNVRDAKAAVEHGPLWSSRVTGLRMLNRHAALFTSHNHVASRHNRAGGEGNRQAATAHQVAAIVHDKLSGQE